jgi:hypothetical protein
VPLTLVSFASCRPEGVSTWRPEDYNAYKFTRAVAGRPIAGSAWVPLADGQILRLSNASAGAAVRRFLDSAMVAVDSLVGTDRGLVLIPLPGPRRIVGSPPSRSRTLAQELSVRSGYRMLDVLRWRQSMPSCRPPDPQMYSDNIITTGSPFRAECILVGDFLSSAASLCWQSAPAERCTHRPPIRLPR